MIKGVLNKCGVLIIALSVFWGCSKDNATSADAGAAGQGTYVYNLAGDTAASVGIEEGKTQRAFYPLLFDFSTGESHLLKTAADSAQYVTGNWDIAFTAQYNSIVIPNNGSYQNTLGYGGPGSFIIMAINTAFDKVTAAPSDDAMKAAAMQSIGWDQGDGQGWFYYSTNNHICVAVTDRTFIFKTSDGLYGKVEFISIYKDHPAVVTDLYWPAPYLSFRYFLQKDGSTNLTTSSNS
ncbi:hypothetical protein A9P82_09475 [Arachidicoccus ginsenosidimutans]|uniref:HmuY family protein n=1 Tax=Arachidicoccus sp. BS20 TaxID=1850526 RepID=UPI0007F0C248|nr:HmuY family protein [Arachidicoccus sp. BS20]ANI89498.1 hypothetical protein A9P82_09475 [Arachidicoccus sp. BS20]